MFVPRSPELRIPKELLHEDRESEHHESGSRFARHNQNAMVEKTFQGNKRQKGSRKRLYRGRDPLGRKEKK